MYRKMCTVFLAVTRLEAPQALWLSVLRVTSGDMGSFPSHIDLILPEPLILEANTHRVLEWKAPYEIKPSGFQTGVRSFSSRTGSLRTVARGASLLPTANFSPRDSTFICSVSRGHVFFFFFLEKRASFLSWSWLLSRIHSDQMAMPLSFSVTGWKETLLTHEVW